MHIQVTFREVTFKGIFKGKSQQEITLHFTDNVKDVASIFLIFGGV